MGNSKAGRIRRIAIVTLVVLGVVLMALALLADTLGLDITPGFGIIQVVAFLVGLTFLTTALFWYIHSQRPKDSPRSLQAEIAVRLGATGLVFAYVSGLSDLAGVGTHVQPNFERPFVGPLQLGGLLLGLFMIVAGLLLYYTSRGTRPSSSLEFLMSRSSSRKTEAEQETTAEEERV